MKRPDDETPRRGARHVSAEMTGGGDSGRLRRACQLGALCGEREREREEMRVLAIDDGYDVSCRAGGRWRRWRRRGASDQDGSAGPAASKWGRTGSRKTFTHKLCAA